MKHCKIILTIFVSLSLIVLNAVSFAAEEYVLSGSGVVGPSVDLKARINIIPVFKMEGTIQVIDFGDYIATESQPNIASALIKCTTNKETTWSVQITPVAFTGISASNLGVIITERPFIWFERAQATGGIQRPSGTLSYEGGSTGQGTPPTNPLLPSGQDITFYTSNGIEKGQNIGIIVYLDPQIGSATATAEGVYEATMTFTMYET